MDMTMVNRLLLLQIILGKVDFEERFRNITVTFLIFIAHRRGCNPEVQSLTLN